MDSVDVDVDINLGRICFVTAAGESLHQRIHAQRTQFAVVLPSVPQLSSSPRHPPRARSKGVWIVMKRMLFVSLTMGMVTAGCVVYPPTPWAATLNLPSKGEVLAVMKKVADYAQSRYPANSEAFWDDGVYHIGMMALYNVSNDDNILAYTETFGEYNSWILVRRGIGNNHNRLAAGQSWIEAYLAGSAVAEIDDTRREIAAQTSSSLKDVTYNASPKAYFSVDSQFMGLPAFAMLGKLDNNSNSGYFDRMYELFYYNKTTLGLYDTTAHLYYRDTSYIYPAKQSPNGRKVFWSRGNGWALGALARVLQELPATDPDRAEYVMTFQQMSAALKAVQRSDGFWNMSLSDAGHYPGPETSGTALFVYGMAWGINNGLLDKTTYEPVVTKAWNAMVTTAVHPSGQLGYVQGVGKEPVPPPQVTYTSSADFGVGVFLLAGSEVFKLAVDGEKYEMENFTATVSSGDSQQDVSDTLASGGTYNQGNFNAVNDYIQYSVRVPAPGTYNVKIRFGKDTDLGKWQFYTAGINVGPQQDAYSSAFTFSEVDLGSVTYKTSGNKVFRFTVTGKNGASSGYGTAIDYVMLTKQ
jgi:unsaturated rhamnogalacturonyl hydrolase